MLLGPRTDERPRRVATVSSVWGGHRMSIGRFRSALVVGLVTAILAGCVSNGYGQGASPSPEPTPSPTLINCGVGVPPVKCNPSLYSPPAGLTPPPVASESPHEQTVETISCGSTFFDATTWAALGDDFGSIECFRFVNGTKWVVFGNGLSLTSPRPEPSSKGAVIAVDACATGDSGCLDPNSAHDFGRFSVTYPPGSMSGKSTLVGTAVGRFLDIANSCMVLTFDLDSMSWYHTDPAELAKLHSGASVAPVFRTPPMVTGATALKTAPPSSLQTCVLP